MPHPFRQRSAEDIAALGCWALQSEAQLTPKPGLVDCHNSGAHTDMNVKLLLHSAEVLYPYFVELAEVGCVHKKDEPHQMFLSAREIGIRAEEAMLHATGGINTHKGALFGLGLLCVAAGVLGEDAEVETLCAYVAEMTKGITAREMGETRWTRLPEQERWQRSGARGEAESGFYHARNIGLPVYFEALQRGGSQDEAALRALLQLMSHLMDTNLLRRGGQEAVLFVQNRAKEVLQHFSIEEVEKFDHELIHANLSPGGSADCLAITLFLSAFSGGPVYFRIKEVDPCKPIHSF